MTTHEEKVREFLSKAAPGWVNEKDRGWHFDIADSGSDDDRVFQQIREWESPAWGPRDDASDDEDHRHSDPFSPNRFDWAIPGREYQAWLAAKPPVDFESPRDEVARVRLGNRCLIESIRREVRLTKAQRVAQKMVELAQGSYGHLDVMELAALAQARPKPRQRPKLDKRDAAYLLRTAFGLSEAKTAAILQQKPTKVHTDVYRLAQALPEDFKQRLVGQFEARLHRKPIVVALPTLAATVSEKQPSR